MTRQRRGSADRRGRGGIAKLASVLLIGSFVASSPSALGSMASSDTADLLRLLPARVGGHELDVTVLDADAIPAGLRDYVSRVGGDPDEVAAAVAGDPGTPSKVNISLTSVPGVDARTLLLTRLEGLEFLPRLVDVDGRPVVEDGLHADAIVRYLYATDGVLVDIWASDRRLADQAVALLPEPDASAYVSADPRVGLLIVPPLRPRSSMDVVSLSPDGDWILAKASMSADDHDLGLATTLCILDSSTLIARSCAEWPAEEPPPWLPDIAWSPDGRLVAVGSSPALDDGDLWLLDVETGRLTNIADDGYAGPVDADEVPPEAMEGVGRPHSPSFRPDGGSLTYVVEGVTGGRWADRVVEVPIDGGDRRVLIDELKDVVEARWADDGSRLFIRTRSDRTRWASDLWVHDASTQTTRRIFEGRDPDGADMIGGMWPIGSGSHILVKSAPRPPCGTFHWIFDVDTGETGCLPDDGGAQGSFSYVTLSSEGTHVLTWRRLDGGPLEIRRLDGRTAALEIPGSSSWRPLGSPHWATDGTALVWTDHGAMLLSIPVGGEVGTQEPGAATGEAGS